MYIVGINKQDDWPGWRNFCVLFYLKEHKLDSTSSALFRFVAENDEARSFAFEEIRANNDENIVEKILFERNCLESMHIHRV